MSLKQSIKDMNALVDATKKKEQNRIQNIKEKCGELYDNSLAIKGRFEELRARL